jgi:hypothetical protein
MPHIAHSRQRFKTPAAKALKEAQFPPPVSQRRSDDVFIVQLTHFLRNRELIWNVRW